MRQAFEWYAPGLSPRDIANELNRRGISAPGVAYRRQRPSRRYGTWSASVLHGDLQHATGMLANPIYMGKVIWNRREWVLNPETKRRVPKMRPESEGIVTEQPELRIIPQPLWDRVQDRRKAQAVGQRSKSLVRRWPGPKYLLSGFLKCAECESNFVVQSYYPYGCAGHKDRGATVCSNAIKVSRKLVENRCLAALKDELFTPEAVDLFVKETTQLLAERKREYGPGLDRLQQRLAQIEGEIVNIMKAIKAGILTASTKAEWEHSEAERARLEELISGATAKADKVVTPLPRARTL